MRPLMTSGAISRPRRLLLLGLVLGLVASIGWLAFKEISTQLDLERAQAALEADDPEAARRYLARCLAEWPSAAEVHFLAARADRGCGDFEGASRHLDEALRIGWGKDAIELEWAMIQAQSGNLRLAEPTLIRAISSGQPGSRSALAVLVPAYMSEFRWVEADGLSQKWVEGGAGYSPAWASRGEILERLRRLDEAIVALREAVHLASGDRRSRLALARLLLETKRPAGEVAEILEPMAKAAPDDLEVIVSLANCREAQGRADDSAALLDRAIAHNPTSASAAHHRGRLELNRGRPAEAISFLRRASELDRSDPAPLYSLYLALKQTGADAEARVVKDRWKRSDADLKLASQLGRAIASAPHDPELRHQMGELFLRNGRDSDGLRWLQSALHERADHAPTHLALALYYERTGHPDLARQHRSFGSNGGSK